MLRRVKVAIAVSVTGVLPKSKLLLQLSVGLLMFTRPVYTLDRTLCPAESDSEVCNNCMLQ